MSTKKANTKKAQEEKDMVLEPGINPDPDSGVADNLFIAADVEAESIAAGVSSAITSGEVEAAEKGRPAYVPYFLPKNILSSEEHQTVILNGKIYQVKAGVRVEVPRGVAEILDHALEQYEAAEALAGGLQK